MTLALADLDSLEVERRRLDEAERAEASSLVKLLRDELLPAWRIEKERLDKIDGWARWNPEDPKLPRGATRELRALLLLSKTPWLGHVVTSTAQCMYVDGWHSATEPAPTPIEADDGEPTLVLEPSQPSRPWRVWQSNGMDYKQMAIHRAMLTYGYAYVTVMPGEDYLGERSAVIKGVSPRRMFAVYDDPINDEYPIYAIEVLRETETGLHLKLYDEDTVRTIRFRESGIDVEGNPQLVVERREEHGCGCCPVVRYCDLMDLDGRTPGEIEPHIPLAARINKTSYDRILVQHFNSWKIRTVTGMAQPDTQEEANRKKLQLRADDMLVADDPDTKFGVLDETPLDGFIRAHEADVEALAAVTQTPTHELTGKLINVSAEGLAMIRASQQQKVAERQRAAGKGHAQTLRLACHIEGDTEAAADFTGKVTWQDTTIRSMSQAVDAWGKAVQMLQIPAQATWNRIPGVDKGDAEEWAKLAAQLDPIERMRAELEKDDEEPEPAQPSPSRGLE